MRRVDSHWLRMWREIFQHITKRRSSKPRQSWRQWLETQLKIALPWMIVTKKGNTPCFLFFFSLQLDSTSLLWPAKILWLMPLFLSKWVLSFFRSLKLLYKKITAHDNTQKLIKWKVYRRYLHIESNILHSHPTENVSIYFSYRQIPLLCAKYPYWRDIFVNTSFWALSRTY